MKFTELNAAVVELRNLLCSFVDDKAISEITIRPPAGESDEASFVRLVNWSYVLLFEAGRVAIPYLLKMPSALPGTESQLQEARGLVHSLRTWSSHNIGFETESDKDVHQQVYGWFMGQGYVGSPDNSEAWQVCFEGLCTEVGTLVNHCRGAITRALSVAEEKDDFIADLRHRVDRNWPSHKFDELVSDACSRLALNLDVRKFCQPRLTKWREFLETVPLDDVPEERITGMIEQDVLNHISNVLPINGSDIMIALNLDPGPEVGEALHRARRLHSSGIRDPERLLECLRKEE